MNELEKCPSSMGEEAWGPGLRRDWISASLTCEQDILAQLLAAAFVVIALGVCLLQHRFPVSGLGGSWEIYFLHHLFLVWFFLLFLFFFKINNTIMVQFVYHNVHPIVRILFGCFFFNKFIAWYKSVQSSSSTFPSQHKVLWCPFTISFSYQPQSQVIHRSAFCLYSFAFSGNLM